MFKAAQFLLVPMLVLGVSPAASSTAEVVPPAVDQAIAASKKGKSNRYYQPSPQMMEQAAALGIRQDGFYWNNEYGYDESSGETNTNYLRFCPSGLVISATSPDRTNEVARWLTCNRIDHTTTRGALVVDGASLVFIMDQRPGEYDYWGGFEGNVDGSAEGARSKLVLYGRARSKRAKTFMQVKKHVFNFDPIG